MLNTFSYVIHLYVLDMMEVEIKEVLGPFSETKKYCLVYVHRTDPLTDSSGKHNTQRTGELSVPVCSKQMAAFDGRLGFEKAAQAYKSFHIHLGPTLPHSSCWLLGHICFCGPSWLPLPLG